MYPRHPKARYGGARNGGNCMEVKSQWGGDWNQVLKVEAYLDTVSWRCDMCELIPVKAGLVARVGEESIKGGRWTWAWGRIC